MNTNRKFFNYLISIFLCVVAILTLFITWSPLFCPILFTFYNNINSIFTNTGSVVMVVGVNYPKVSFMWLGALFTIFTFLLFLLAKKRKAPSGFFWINGISISIILSHLIMWLFLCCA